MLCWNAYVLSKIQTRQFFYQKSHFIRWYFLLVVSAGADNYLPRAHIDFPTHVLFDVISWISQPCNVGN